MRIQRILMPALLAAGVMPTLLAAQACPDPAALTGGMDGPLAHVRYLADDALEGRLAGSPGERCAGDYIAGRFAALGLAPAGENGSYFQTLPLASAVNPHAPTGEGRNVVALLPGSDPALADEYIIIGAHYDHLGRGEFGSTRPEEKGAIHNGADDNASGVAALLHAAELLARAPRTARPVLFLAFTGEESGLLGSAFFTRQPTRPLTDARVMINLDMVGRLREGGLIVYGVDTAREWRDVLARIAAEAGLEMKLNGEGYGPSDHTSFYLQDMPVLHFFTNTHGDYHAPSDDWERIDAAGLEQLGVLVAGLSRDIADQRLQLTLVRGAGQKPQAGAGGGYGAWLGTVPDFSPVARGVLLGGVSAGSPAEQAGLRKGDVLIGLAGRDVSDLQGMTDVLRQHRPGDQVEIVVLRDGRELRLSATLGSRGAR
ncbi:MAG TPA: M20/M25/M40 family metallo-hydrolase [Longimicrobiales bacterium]|nr:M20/M25/M40 family metallo-hydrolase [Longimicrobiales bacterium]